MRFIKNRGIKGLAFSLVATILFLSLSLAQAFLPVDNFIMDHMLQHEDTINKDIRIIGIDDKSLEEMGKLDTWDRSYYAALINKLNSDDHKPLVIGFDILFTGKSENEEADNSLVQAAKAGNNVVLGMNLLFNNSYDDEGISSNVTVSYPFKELKEVTELGYVNTVLDKSDSYVRKTIPAIGSYSSFSYKIYQSYAEKKGLAINEYDSNSYYRFKYSAKPERAYTVISLADILHERIPLDDFKDSIVLVGAYTTGLGDDFYTPIERGSKMNGVEIHANLIDAYLKDNLISDVSYIANIIISIIIALIFSFLIYRSKAIASSAYAGAGIITLALVEFILLEAKIYYPLNSLIIFIALIYIANIAYNYLSERRAKLNTINAFKKYVAPAVVDKAIKDGKFEINLGGEKRNVACLFVDIRGFTTMSEAMAPDEVVEILNSYLSLVTEAIFKNGGTLDKFIGDAAMALFNAPFSLDDYIYKACKCAIDIRAGSDDLDKECLERFNRSVGFGIGINSGEAVVGNIGSETRMDYTAIGDTINTASRLEGSAKRNEIIISEDIYLSVKERISCEYIGELTLKGKKEGFRAYKIISLKED